MFSFDANLNELSYNIPDGLNDSLIIQYCHITSASKFAFTAEVMQAAPPELFPDDSTKKKEKRKKMVWKLVEGSKVNSKNLCPCGRHHSQVGRIQCSNTISFIT